MAVKILDLRRLRRCRGGLDAIEREVSVLKRLKKHPNLIELIDVVRLPERGKMYIVLEMANGCTVEQLAALAGGKLPELQVARIVYFVLLALQYMHGKGVVHRDIKPSNVMLTAGGHVKISDFGVAEFLNEYKSEDNVSRTSGSPAFQAPEIARGELGYSGMKVDVWALGVTTYLLLTGHIPFGGDNLIALFDTIAQGLYDEPDSFSPSLKDVIRRMLIVDWRARDSVDDLLKHPWVIKGSQRVSEQQQLEQAWQPIPRKHIRILDLVKRMYNEEIPTQTPTITTTHTSSSDGTSPKVSASSSSSACSVQ